MTVTIWARRATHRVHIKRRVPHHLINCKEVENTAAGSHRALFYQRPDDVVPYSHQMTAQWSGFTELRISFVHITAKILFIYIYNSDISR